jgi:hypothetical protein
MPSKCPACETQIRHDGNTPEPNRVYRCPVCRLELVLDSRTNLMNVAPLAENPIDPKPFRRRTSKRP